MNKSLLVSANLLTPLAGDPPILDSLLEYAVTFLMKTCKKITRDSPAPGFCSVPLPLSRLKLNGIEIWRCSNPIMEKDIKIKHEFLSKQLSVENALLLSEKNRRNVPINRGEYKSIRKPIKIIHCKKIAWFCHGKKDVLMRMLERIKAIGNYRKIGYGLIKNWDMKEIDRDYSWYAVKNKDMVLMRNLPLCDELPKNLIGYKKSYGAFAAPYWHPERIAEIVEPV